MAKRYYVRFSLAVRRAGHGQHNPERSRGIGANQVLRCFRMAMTEVPNNAPMDTSRIIDASTFTCGRNSALNESQMWIGIVFTSPLLKDVMM
jgi:hypothetical protein